MTEETELVWRLNIARNAARNSLRRYGSDSVYTRTLYEYVDDLGEALHRLRNP